MQLRSLDVSQNAFEDDYGDELRVLSQLTALECLKLANCRMLQVGQCLCKRYVGPCPLPWQHAPLQRVGSAALGWGGA